MVSIKVLPFKYKHYGMLLTMLEDQKTAWLPTVSYKTLPKIGYIAILGKHPVAAGFLRRIEGGYGYVDTVVSNPHFGSQVRHDAISRIFELIMQEASDIGLVGVLGSTTDQGILKRALEWGYNICPDTLISIKLI
jgi:hypothetical protein